MASHHLASMETSNTLPVMQPVSPISLTAEPSSFQPGAAMAAVTELQQVPAVVHPQPLNLQQSIFLQQHAVPHQPAINAGKSPAEIAAARAAEISKQLEESGAVADQEPSKKNKSRSRTKSPSRSHSRSKSRSPALSPIKRLRRRSRSLSPIRYRRDYYPSHGSRDYYGYRGHSYRSNYRGGYSKYSRYRYDRDYDHYLRNQTRNRERRRSRTRSPNDRNRGRRRSETLSPVKKRSHSSSPEGSRKRSASPASNQNLSRSQRTSEQLMSRKITEESLSVSRGSDNGSPAQYRNSIENQEKSARNFVAADLPELEPSKELNKNQMVSNIKMSRGSNGTREGGTESSSSPARSLPVSLDSDKYTSTSNEASAKRRHAILKRFSSKNDVLGNISSARKHSQEIQKMVERRNTHEHDCESKKLSQSSLYMSDDDGEGTELVDDWREDLKKAVKGKDILSRGEEDKILPEGLKPRYSEADSTKSVVYHMAKLNDCDLKHEFEIQGLRCPTREDSLMIEREFCGPSNKDIRTVITHDESPQDLSRKNTKELSDVCDDSESSNSEDLVFEGPQPAKAMSEEGKKSIKEGIKLVAKGGIDSGKRTTEGDTTLGESEGQMHLCNSEIGAEDRYRTKVVESKKRGDGSLKHDSSRSKHKRHKKRHRHVSTDEVVDRPSKRHRKKHRRESKHSKREQSKRRQRHKSRFSSTDNSSSAKSEDESSIQNKEKNSRKRRASKRYLSESSTSSASLA